MPEVSFNCGNCGETVSFEYDCDPDFDVADSEIDVTIHDWLVYEQEWVVRKDGVFCPNCQDAPYRLTPRGYRDIFEEPGEQRIPGEMNFNVMRWDCHPWDDEFIW